MNWLTTQLNICHIIFFKVTKHNVYGINKLNGACVRIIVCVPISLLFHHSYFFLHFSLSSMNTFKRTCMKVMPYAVGYLHVPTGGDQ